MALSRTIKHLRRLVILTISLEAIGIFLHASQIDLLGNIMAGDFVKANEINEMFIWGKRQFLFHLGLYSFTALFFVRWSYVSQKNKKYTEFDHTRPLASVLYLWLVPVANFIRPYQLILGFTLAQYCKRDLASLQSYRRLITIWWILWLISGPFGRFLAYLYYPNGSVFESYSYLFLYLGLEFISIICGLLFVVILGRQLRFFRTNN